MIEVLGDIRGWGPGVAEPVRITSPNQRIVLAVLVARHPDVVSVHDLVAAVWEDEPPASAARTVGSYVSRLRNVMGDAIAIVPGGYRLVLDDDLIDIRRYEQLVRAARKARGTDAIARYRDADRLWRGAPFAELTDAAAVTSEVVRLETVRLDAQDRLAAELLASGAVADAAATAAATVAEHPLRESAWITLIDAQAVSSPGDALRAARRAAEALAEAGLVPSDALAAAEQRALTGGSVGRPSRRVERRPLPGTATPLIGRDASSTEVDAALARSGGVVTLVGPGGVGKTRLAIETARRRGPRHAAGVAFVPLDEVEESAAVVPAVLEAAGVGGLVSSVADDLAALADLDLLLVLDNCEHVLDAVADFASRVGGSRLTLLATSRQSIGVEGERVVAVAPLMADGPQLFAARAASAGVDTDPDHPAVARIVANVDGLPLAIEMAAALTPSLGLDDLVELTAATPSTMRSPIRGAAKRQRHLGALIDWSLDRLVDVDRLAVGDLAVFEGTFTREHAAALIGSQRLTTLPELVDRSLLVADTSDGRARYRMLRTVRERVWQRHDDREATSERHADIVSTFVGLLDDGLQTDDEATVHGELLERYADLRSAHAWARRRRPELAVGLTACTYNWAHSRQIADPFRWADELGAGGHGGEPAVALAMAQARFLDGKADEALALLGQVVDRSTGRIRLAVHETIGDINLALGRLDESIDTNVELVRLSEKADDIHYAVIGLVGQAIGHRYGGRRSEAERLLDVIGSVAAVAPTDRGWCRYARAEVIGDEDVEGAADDFRVATELADTVGNRFLGGVARVSLSALRARAGAPEASIDDLVETIVEWRQRGMRSYLETSLRNLVILLHRVERDREAAELLGALDRWAEFDTFGDEARALDEVRDRIERRLGAPTATRHRRIGADRRFDATVDEMVVGLGEARPPEHRDATGPVP